MLHGNLYGLVITMLTFVIAVILTMRQVEQTGVHVELTISPVILHKAGGEKHTARTAGTETQSERPDGPGGSQSASKPKVGVTR